MRTRSDRKKVPELGCDSHCKYRACLTYGVAPERRGVQMPQVNSHLEAKVGQKLFMKVTKNNVTCMYTSEVFHKRIGDLVTLRP